MKTARFIYICLVIFGLAACEKMDEKPKQSLVVPATLQDMQGMMDNSSVMNFNHTYLGEVSSDNFTLTPANFNSLSSTIEKNAYTWYKNVFEGAVLSTSWNLAYERILYCNIVLEGLDKLAPGNAAEEINNVKGQALFHRSYAFFLLAQEFSKPYDATTANQDLGIPLRTVSDLNSPSKRASVQETFDRIVNDLLSAKFRLPSSSLYKTRPSKAAAFGLLSRAYLAKGDYLNAYLNADSCLKLYNTLINYNTLNQTAPFPFVLLNNEVIFQSSMVNSSILAPNRAIINDALYQSYLATDLRKSLFFSSNGNNTYAFKGSYYGATLLFSGIATDEVYLTRAECHARLGRTSEALTDLNTLLSNRFRTGNFTPVTAANADEALIKILSERRKELLLRGIRWSDLRRLNKEPRFAITLSRTLGTDTFTLPANDPRYTFPIPDYVIAFNGIEQNP